MTYTAVETDVFSKWRNELRDTLAQTKIRVRIARAEAGNFGDWKTRVVRQPSGFEQLPLKTCKIRSILQDL
jgi:putative addiction module killer protein